MARFQNYVMLFKIAARFTNIWARHFGTSIIKSLVFKIA